MKTLVATIEEAPGITANKTGDMPIQNLRIAIKKTNRFGLEVLKHMKVVAFNAVAVATSAIGFKPGEHVFLDDCRIEDRPYEGKDGKMIMSQDLIPGVVERITKKQFADIGAQLAAAARAEAAAAAAAEKEDFTV